MSSTTAHAPRIADADLRTRSFGADTSMSAAASVRAADNELLKAAIVEVLAEAGPLTDGDIFEQYKQRGGLRSPSRVRTARHEMTDKKFGMPVVRLAEGMGESQYHRQAQRWEVVA